MSARKPTEKTALCAASILVQTAVKKGMPSRPLFEHFDKVMVAIVSGDYLCDAQFRNNFRLVLIGVLRDCIAEELKPLGGAMHDADDMIIQLMKDWDDNYASID